MYENYKISVIIPVYNTEKYLRRCLDSVLQNTYHNLEVICINDGSSDKSADILEKYAKEDSRVIVINKANGGVSEARNSGLDRVSGEYIAFIDSDDWVHPQYFEALFLALYDSGAEIAACKYVSTEEYEMEYRYQNLEMIEKNLMTSSDAINIGLLKRLVWGRLYKRSLIRDIRFEKGIKWGEDTIFSISSLCCASNIVLIDAELYYYFQHEASIMHTVLFGDQLTLARYYIDHYERVNSNMQSRIYLCESIKQSLACRYLGRFDLNSPEQRECGILIERCRMKLKEKDELSRKEKIIFKIFIKVPFLYRLFRIIDDPTLLQWEKNEKIKKRSGT